MVPVGSITFLGESNAGLSAALPCAVRAGCSTGDVLPRSTLPVGEVIENGTPQRGQNLASGLHEKKQAGHALVCADDGDIVDGLGAERCVPHFKQNFAVSLLFAAQA